MAPLTKEALNSLIDEMVGSKIGSTVEERLKAFQATQSATMAALVSGLKGSTLAERAAKGIHAAQMVLSVAGAKLAQHGGAMLSPVDYAKKQFGADSPVTKALSASIGSEGGLLIGEQMAPEVIELLRPASAVRKLNPVVAPMDAGNLTLPKISGGAAAGYIGENANVPKTQQTFGSVRAQAKKLGALVPISNDLIRRRTANTDTMVRDDMVAAMAQRGDLAMIRDVGTQFSPKGLRYWCLAANLIPANATVNLANVTVDLGKLILALANGNVRMLRPGWIFAPRIWIYLMSVRDGNGNFAFRDEMQGGTLWGFPFAVTTQVPINLGGGTNESEVYLADFADVVLAEATNILIDASTEAAYHDGTNVVAAFSQDQTVIRTIMEHDLVMRHEESIAILTAVTWA